MIYLKEMRERAGLSQAQLAEALGVHTTRVSQWEVGKADIPAKREQEILTILNCTEAELYNGDVATNIQGAIESAKLTVERVDERFLKKIKAKILQNLNDIDEINLSLLQLSAEANMEYDFFYTLLYKDVSIEDKRKIIFAFINALN